MRQYAVQPGDSPASIAGRDDMAGCPRCAIDLVRANPHKATRTLPNGFVTFTELHVDEVLNIPTKWDDGTLDRLPEIYFENLPHYDGVTGVGAVQVDIGPASDVFPTSLVDAARTAYAAIDSDPNYCASVSRVGSSVNSAVHAFKTEWNASQPPVPINTGNFEQETKNAMLQVLGYAPTACPSRTYSPPPVATPVAPVAVVTPKKSLSTGGVVGISLVVAGVVGGAVHFFTRKPRRVRRIRK